MGADDRNETKRIKCNCGSGEFVFYTCQYDGWSFLNHPDVEWYEMHIFCDNCIKEYEAFKPHLVYINGLERWVLRIEAPESPPPH